MPVFDRIISTKNIKRAAMVNTANNVSKTIVVNEIADPSEVYKIISLSQNNKKDFVVRRKIINDIQI